MDRICDTQLPMLPPFIVQETVTILSEVRDYNHAMMNIPAMWRTTRGKGVRVAILDTGMPVHNDLRPKSGHSFVPGYTYDRNGHGTHVAGIIGAIADNGMGVAGIAPDAELHCCAVLGANGNGTIDQIIKGIRWAVDVVGAQIINLSLGLPSGMRLVRELEAACNYATSQGATLFCATGNSGNAVGQPAIFDSVISVAAVNDAKEHASFSCYGSQVDFAAGGVQVYSTFLNNGYAMLSGTSMATPAIAAVAALIQADKFAGSGAFLTRDELYAKLRKIAYDVNKDGFDSKQGYGIPVFYSEDRPADPVEQPETPPAPAPEQPAQNPVLVGDGNFGPKPGDIPMPPKGAPAEDAPPVVVAPPAKRSNCPGIDGALARGLAVIQEQIDAGVPVNEAAAAGLAEAGTMMTRILSVGAVRAASVPDEGGVAVPLKIPG